MSNQRWHALSEKSSDICYGALLAAAAFQFLLMVGSEGFFAFLDPYAIIPPIFALGILFTQKLSVPAGRQLHLALAAVIWYVIAQTRHVLAGQTAPAAGFFFCSYLLAFPFAAVAQDGERQRGLRAVSAIYLAASLVLVAFSALLIADLRPGFLKSAVYSNETLLLNMSVFWDGARLRAVWHPNTCSNIFMVGIAVSLGAFFLVKKLRLKLALLIIAAAEFAVMALTNSRTAILTACLYIGGMLFFRIWRGGWKRFLAGLTVALPVIVGLFIAANMLYDGHYEYLLSKQQQTTGAAAQMLPTADSTPPVGAHTAAAQSETVRPAASPAVLKASSSLLENVTETKDELIGSSRQGSLLQDMGTLNGRVGIWKNVLWAAWRNPSVILWGTDDPGAIISRYSFFTVAHAHNSWAETFLSLGLPGLLLSLVFTFIAVRDALFLLFRQDDMHKKSVALLILCMLIVAFMEPYLFAAHRFTPFFEFLFFLMVGYMTQWRKAAMSSAG